MSKYDDFQDKQLRLMEVSEDVCSEQKLRAPAHSRSRALTAADADVDLMAEADADDAIIWH